MTNALPKLSATTIDLRMDQVQRRKGARPVVKNRVAELAKSIAEVGLLSPVPVRPRKEGEGTFELLAGNHRYEACLVLNMTTIPAIIVDAGDLHAELIEIDENLCREGLTPAQEALAIARRKELYEQLHPEAAHGGNRKSTRQIGDLKSERFTKATAAATGLSERSIQRAATRVKKVGTSVIKQIIGTSLDKRGELDALAALPAADQATLIERAAAGERISVRSPSCASISISSDAWRAKQTALLKEAPLREDCEWAAEQARLSAARFYPDMPVFLDRRNSGAK